MGNLVPTVLLIFITVVWGWSFVLVKDAIEEYGVVSFLAARFVIATVLMAPLSAGRITRASLRTGTLLGLVLAAIYISQTFGLRYTTATKSGLITGLGTGDEGVTGCGGEGVNHLQTPQSPRHPVTHSPRHPLSQPPSPSPEPPSSPMTVATLRLVRLALLVTGAIGTAAGATFRPSCSNGSRPSGWRLLSP